MVAEGLVVLAVVWGAELGGGERGLGGGGARVVGGAQRGFGGGNGGVGVRELHGSGAMESPGSARSWSLHDRPHPLCTTQRLAGS